MAADRVGAVTGDLHERRVLAAELAVAVALVPAELPHPFLEGLDEIREPGQLLGLLKQAFLEVPDFEHGLNHPVAVFVDTLGAAHTRASPRLELGLVFVQLFGRQQKYTFPAVLELEPEERNAGETR